MYILFCYNIFSDSISLELMLCCLFDTVTNNKTLTIANGTELYRFPGVKIKQSLN